MILDKEKKLLDIKKKMNQPYGKNTSGQNMARAIVAPLPPSAYLAANKIKNKQVRTKFQKKLKEISKNLRDARNSINKTFNSVVKVDLAKFQGNIHSKEQEINSTYNRASALN